MRKWLVAFWIPVICKTFYMETWTCQPLYMSVGKVLKYIFMLLKNSVVKTHVKC